ncbi:MAG: ATP-binding protein [Bdellovibrionaceae bacterium]|nr:ATP-binding protein [Pseudobdellovibrionaceae bacterium]
MFKLSSPLFFLKDTRLIVFFIRSFVHFFVLLSLIAHQFLFPYFIDSNLSVFGYTLCFFILFFDSLFVFFYKDQQKNFELFLFFLSALFLAFLTILLTELIFLPLIFFLIFLYVFPLFLVGKSRLAFIFLLYLLILFPIAFSLKNFESYEGRLSLIILTHLVLFAIFIFSFLFVVILNLFQNKNLLNLDLKNDKFSKLNISLNLSKKLQSSLNFLVKNFLEKENKSIDSDFYKIKKELQNVKKFIEKFIEIQGLNKITLSNQPVDIKYILQESLKRIESHKNRSENLKIYDEGFTSFEINASSKHLIKCFEEVLINAFEALQNEKNPIVKIYCLRQRANLSIRFLDNGHGVEEDDIDHLFEPLFSKRFGLRGLGLYYVKKVIKAHQGEIKVERENPWTKFTINLPLTHSYYDKGIGFFKSLKIKKKVA